jgi:hypothetical protein
MTSTSRRRWPRRAAASQRRCGWRRRCPRHRSDRPAGYRQSSDAARRPAARPGRSRCRPSGTPAMGLGSSIPFAQQAQSAGTLGDQRGAVRQPGDGPGMHQSAAITSVRQPVASGTSLPLGSMDPAGAEQPSSSGGRPGPPGADGRSEGRRHAAERYGAAVRMALGRRRRRVRDLPRAAWASPPCRCRRRMSTGSWHGQPLVAALPAGELSARQPQRRCRRLCGLWCAAAPMPGSRSTRTSSSTT